MLRYILLFAAVGTLCAQEPLRVGAFETDITPEKLPITTSGSFLSKTSTTLDGRLHVRALAFDNGERRLVIAIADSLMIPRELVDRIKYRVKQSVKLDAGDVMVAATHTHSAPPVMGALGTDEDAAYSAFFEMRVVEAIEGAVRKLTPARIGWTKVMAPEHTNNRRWILREDKVREDPFGQRTIRANMHPGYQNPEFVGPSGPTDPELSVISIQHADGRPMAMLANYSMHYVGVPGSVVSADYYGYFCEKVREQVGGDYVAIMSQGTSGDGHYMDYSQPQKNVTVPGYAQEMAAKAVAALKGIEYRSRVKLGEAHTELTLSRRLPDKARLDWAATVWTRKPGALPATQQEVYAREQMYIATSPVRQLFLQAMRIDDLALTAIPDEVYAITGLKLKLQSPFAQTVNFELANGAEGYIPPPEQHRLGGYTTWPARTAGLEVEAEPKIVDALLGLMETMAGGKRKAYTEPAARYAVKPMAAWQCGEFSGTAAKDASGNEHDAQYTGDVAFFLPGQVGRAVHLVGGKLRAALPGLSADKFTVDFWFWNGTPASGRTLFSHGTEALGLDGESLTYGAARGTTAIPLRQWTRVTLVRDGGTVRVHLNGNAKPELTAPAPAVDNVRELSFGGFEGKLDEVAVWDRAMKPEEIVR